MTYDTGSGLLTVKSGKVTDTLTLLSPDTGTFKVKDDGHGGTKVVLVVLHAKPVTNAAIAETKGIEERSDAHHGSRAADNFEFTSLTRFTGLDHAWTSGFHFGPDQHSPTLNAGDGEAGWSEPTHMDFGHHTTMLSGHDFIL